MQVRSHPAKFRNIPRNVDISVNRRFLLWKIKHPYCAFGWRCVGGVQNIPICKVNGSKAPPLHRGMPFALLCEIGTCHACSDHWIRPRDADLCDAAELSLMVCEHQCGETQVMQWFSKSSILIINVEYCWLLENQTVGFVAGKRDPANPPVYLWLFQHCCKVAPNTNVDQSVLLL